MIPRPRFARHCLLLVALCAAAPAYATSPNDHWADRRLATLPYAITETDAQTAGVDASDPPPPCAAAGANPQAVTLWYGYTAGDSTEYLTITAGNSAFAGAVAAYTGTPGAFRIVSGGCAPTNSLGGAAARIVGLRLAPHTSISIIVSSFYPIGPQQVIPVSIQATPVLAVTKTADTLDGACDADCSLREAIAQANLTPSVVLIPAGTYTLTRAGTDEDGNSVGDLDLDASMAIYGAGPDLTTVDAGGIDRVLDLSRNCCRQYSLGDLRLVNGHAYDGGVDGQIGGGLRGATQYCYVGMERVRIENNSADFAGGGIGMYCPGTLRQSVLAANVSVSYGGGLYYLDFNEHALQIEGSEIAANRSLVGAGVHTQGRLIVQNSTVHHNLAQAGGGGINQGHGILILANATIMYNRGSDIPSLSNTGAGIFMDHGSGNRIIDSVIARNTSANPADEADCGMLTSSFVSAYNHVGAPGPCDFSGVGDVTGSDPGLATEAAYNGGVGTSFAVPDGAAVLDAGDPAGCNDADGLPLSTDQRGEGYPRPLGSACDKGALEHSALAAPPTPDLAAADDSGVSDSDDDTASTLLHFDGACAIGTTLRLRDGGRTLASTPCASGNYSLDVAAPFAEGLHPIVADANDGASTSLPSPALTVTVDLTAPTPPIVGGPASSDPLDFVIAGTAAETTGRIDVRHDGSVLCSALLSGAADWSCAASVGRPGFYAVEATHTDLAGNTSAASVRFVIRVGDVLFEDGFEAP